MMNIKIKYFASLRERAGKSEEDLDLQTDQTPAKLYEMLSHEYGFSLSAKEIKYSVNNEYVDENVLLRDNDTVVFIPPVAGG
jgi:molybdopterin converting factor subunit 1